MAEAERTIWVTCAECNHKSRNHRILSEKIQQFCEDPHGGPLYRKDFHRFVQCMGCETYKYVVSSLDCTDPYYAYEEDFKVYPDGLEETNRRKTAIAPVEAKDDTGKMLIPDAVWKMYKETVAALNANARTLAGGGLRAVVEAICLNKEIEAANLQKKIDQLVEKQFLTSAQADLLHEERYLGNSALHELATPSSQDVEDGLGIVEGMINTIYVLPEKAERLKQRRQAKGQQTVSTHQ